MASGEGADDAVRIVDSKDLPNTSVVHVESTEKVSFFSFFGGSKNEEKPAQADSSGQKEKEPTPPKHEIVHNGENVKTTYDVEEDVPPSLLEQLKRKVHWNGR